MILNAGQRTCALPIRPSYKRCIRISECMNVQFESFRAPVAVPALRGCVTSYYCTWICLQDRIAAAKDDITERIRENTNRLDQLNMLLTEKRDYEKSLDSRQKNVVCT